jgi:hypothetical protein
MGNNLGLAICNASLRLTPDAKVFLEGTGRRQSSLELGGFFGTHLAPTLIDAQD